MYKGVVIFLGDYGRPVVLLTSSCVAWHYILLSLCVRAGARACVRASILVTIMKIKSIPIKE